MPTPHLEKQLTVFAAFSTVDLAALAAAAGKLSLSYSHAAQLSFNVVAAEHTVPIERLSFVRFWIEDATLDDGTTEQDEDHPLFEGYVESVGPGGDANRVNVVCYDPTFRVSREITIMSVAWQAGTPHADPGSQVPPTDGTGAVPRLVYNAIDEADNDYPLSIGQSGTLGQIVAGILELSQEALWWRNATPGAIIDGSQLAYDADDLSGLTFVPQEKIVWESESPRAGIERLQRYEPRLRMLWHPGERLWRFRDITAAPEVTLRLNDPTIDFPVLSLDLTPSLDKCFTALKIYGPATTTNEEYIWYHPDVEPDGWTNTLVPVGDPVGLEFVGALEIETYTAWQIVDTTKRRAARTLPDWTSIRTSEYIWCQTKSPQFLLSWDAGTTWIGASGVWLDWLNGQANFPTTVPYVTGAEQYGQSQAATGQHFFPPNAAKLVWAPFSEPLTVRVPETGFSGTAYSVAGLEVERRLNDDQLAIGIEYGIPVTSSARRAQMTLMAQSQLDKAHDITWVGGCVLDGLDFSWCRLNRSVSFEASDGSGGTTTTGWEAIKAYVTDVEFDFAEQTTTIQFSSDRAEAIGEDPALIKQRLGIRALEQVRYQQSHLLFRTSVNWRGGTFREISGIQTISGFNYVDPQTGMTVFST